jgi:hypothetical protein
MLESVNKILLAKFIPSEDFSIALAASEGFIESTAQIVTLSKLIFILEP